MELPVDCGSVEEPRFEVGDFLLLQFQLLLVVIFDFLDHFGSHGRIQEDFAVFLDASRQLRLVLVVDRLVPDEVCGFVDAPGHALLLGLEDDGARVQFVVDVFVALGQVVGPRVQVLLRLDVLAHGFEKQMRPHDFDDLQQVEVGLLEFE